MLGAPAFLGNKAVFTQSRMVRASGRRRSVGGGSYREEQRRPSGVQNAAGGVPPPGHAARKQLEGATGRILSVSVDHPGVGLLRARGWQAT